MEDREMDSSTTAELSATGGINGMIIGAQKSGTTLLKHLLAQHPQIQTHAREEFTYFLNEEEYGEPVNSVLERYFGESATDSFLLAKCADLLYFNGAPRRLIHHNPDMRLVVVVRDPTDRAFSAYQHARRMGWEEAPSFHEAIRGSIELPDDPIASVSWNYLRNGKYTIFLDEFTSHFGPDRLLLLEFQSLVRNQQAAARRVFQHFELDSGIEVTPMGKKNPAKRARSKLLSKLVYRRHPVRRIIRACLPVSAELYLLNAFKKFNFVPKEDEGDQLSDAMRDKLAEYYAPYNQALCQRFGVDISNWTYPKGEFPPTCSQGTDGPGN